MSQNTNIFDQVAKAVAKAKKDGMKSTQVNNLLEFSQSTDNVDEILLYIMRQSERNHFQETAKVLVDYIHKTKDINKTREFLGLFKWSFEAFDKIQNTSFDNFESMVKAFLSSSPSNGEGFRGGDRPSFNRNQFGKDKRY